MQNILQKLQPKTPESSSSSLKASLENSYIDYLGPQPDTPPQRDALRSHEAFRRVGQATRLAEKVTRTPDQESRKAACKRVVGQTARLTADIIDRRNSEIRKDGGFSYVANLPSPQRRLSFAEVVLGKNLGAKADRAAEKVASAGFQPTATYSVRVHDYMAREAEASQRAIGRNDMQLIPFDSHTWIWDVAGDDRQQTYRFHIEPFGILREEITPIGSSNAVNDRKTLLQGEELERFAKLTASVHHELTRSVYRLHPDIGSIGEDFALAA